ncbi:MAG: ornithine carbamoyltransferase [Armatimonadota bacterium]|nr:ornithine carbamoyltransferase [bacterium]
MFDGVVFKSEERPEAAVELRGKSLLDIAQLSRAEIDVIFDMTRKLKDGVIPPSRQRRILAGKTLAMIFEKPSLRTRVSFETGIFQLGGHGIYLGPNDIALGKRESVADVARTIGRMCDIVMARVFEHEKVTGLAEYAGVPVINALSDLEHPCQALADFYTIIEHKGKLEGLKLAFIGDGNNVAHSLMLLAAKVGMNFAIGCPKDYEPDENVTAKAREFAKETGATIEITNDPIEAVKGADVVYTDVWASMGQEAEAEERAKTFADFQVNSDLMSHAKPDAIFEHCLPAHRGSEVTDEVIDSKQSVVFDEAENRLHAQKAVMVLLAG